VISLDTTGRSIGAIMRQSDQQLRKLGELRAAGVLTDAEFVAKKAELLKRN
jgi:hypothetical protein